MSSEPAIALQGVSKMFRIFRRPDDRLRQLFRFGRPPLYQEFWSLRHIDLQVSPGETVGLLGRNGAGKSTLLRVIAGITPPTSGTLRLNGKVSTVLELGAAFDAEFTGRENAFLGGVILGVPNAEKKSFLEKVIAFADLEFFIDQPVKFYSTGMYLRLAFSVAINVEPDILLIDEALAVGDAAFQEKCVDRIRDLQRRGTTILLTSHDPGMILQLCRRAVLLEGGRVLRIADPESVLAEYQKLVSGKSGLHGN